MALTIPNPTLGTGISDSTLIDANMAAIAAKFGNINNTDIQTGAGIDITKLSASYQYMPITVQLATGAAANDVIVPVYNDGLGDWTVVGCQWVTLDNGDPSAVFKIEWGLLDGTATDVIANQWTLVSTIDTVTLSGAANVSTQGVDASPATTTLAFGGAGVYRSLRFYVSTLDADATSIIYITLMLKRQIKT